MVEGSAAAPSRIEADELAGVQTSTMASPAKSAARPYAARISRGIQDPRRLLAIIPASVCAVAFVGAVLLWPERLAHPGIDHMRRAIGIACALHLGAWSAMLVNVRGPSFRQLPRFVGRGGTPLDSDWVILLWLGLIGSAFITVIAAGAQLGQIVAFNDVLARGRKGPYVDGAVIPLVLASVTAIGGYAGWVLFERAERRLTAMFRAQGSDWSIAAGRLAGGEQVLYSVTKGSGRNASTRWRARSSATLVVETSRGQVQVATEGLVWGLDGQPQREAELGGHQHLRVGPGDHVVLAGRIGDGPELRASGAESLLLLAGPRPDLFAAVQRGLWMRRLTLAIPPVVAALTLLLV